MLLLILFGIPNFLSGLFIGLVKIRKSFDELSIFSFDLHMNRIIFVLVLMQILCILLIDSKIDNSFDALIFGCDQAWICAMNEAHSLVAIQYGFFEFVLLGAEAEHHVLVHECPIGENVSHQFFYNQIESKIALEAILTFFTISTSKLSFLLCEDRSMIVCEYFLMILMVNLQTALKIIFNIKSMRPSKQEMQECYHSPFIKNSRKPLLKNIVEEIKHLQNYVSQMDIDLPQTKEIRQVRSEKKKKVASVGRSSKESKKREREETSGNKYQNIKTIRKSPKGKNHSLALKQSRHSHHQQSAQRECSEQPGQTMQFPLSYISLQFQNIELERQNMRLQKKLLQQELIMQRREKQLLKNRLKKIKTHNIITMLPSSGSAHKNQATQAHSSTYDNTPIKIKIPEFKSKHEESLLSYSKSKRQHKLSDNYTTKTFESFASFKNDEDQDDELLISRLSSQKSGKENAGLLERQFWTLLSQSQTQKCEKKWEIRQALGDIANKLKAIRRQ